MPQHVNMAGPRVSVAPTFEFIDVSLPSMDRLGKLQRGLERYNRAIRLKLAKLSPSAVSGALTEATVSIESIDYEMVPSSKTSYDYNISVVNRKARLSAFSVYGALYAMETFSQLIDTAGFLESSTVEVRDQPDYVWRGLMLDAGRRFIPMDTVRNLMDTMAAVKLNVLHMHMSDRCRWGVESKVYPSLTGSLMGDMAGFYSQADVAALIEYAGDRGIRVIPEFDVPGHSRGMRSLKSKGLEYCLKDKSEDQLYNDPAGKTFEIVHTVMKEMASLFKDEVFNIGCDETAVTGPCTLNSTFEFERKLMTAIESEFGKTPETWEEGLFDADAATKDTIVNAWSTYNASQIIATGRKAVESKDKWFYFTDAAKGGPEGWSKCWNDIGYGVPADKKSMLLGGEMSMWTDRYCYINQCNPTSTNVPIGAPLFPPSQDTAFAASIGGMIWPRGFVAAGAFWHYDESQNPSSDEFVDRIWKLNDKIAADGGLTCPSNCTCDELTACGKPYVQQ